MRKKKRTPEVSQFGKKEGDRAAQKSLRGLNSWYLFTSLMEHFSGASNNFVLLGAKQIQATSKTEMNFKLLRQ